MAKKGIKNWTPDVQKLEEHVYTVQSETDLAVRYQVEVKNDHAECNCLAKTRGRLCKHQAAVLRIVNEEGNLNAKQMDAFLPDGVTPKVDQADSNPEKQEKLMKLGYRFDEVTSAMQKEIRRGDEEAAVYWAMLLYGRSPQYAWKRVMICAAEDIGLADPDTVQKVLTLGLAWKMCKEGAWYVDPQHIVMAVVLLCRAPKSTEIDDLKSLALEQQRAGVRREMAAYSKDVHTEAGRSQGAGNRAWFDCRHLTFGIPVNAYTKKLAKVVPDWFSEELRRIFESK